MTTTVTTTSSENIKNESMSIMTKSIIARNQTKTTHNIIYNEDCILGMKKIPSGSVNMVLTDIPYGEVNDRAANSEICYLDKGVADVVNFNLETLTETLIEKTCENGSIYMFCGTEQISTIVKVMRKNGLSTRVITWEKTNPCPLNGKRIWLSGTEFCVFGRKKGATFNGHCKNNVLRYPIYHNKIHKTPKPVGLFEELITTSSNEGDTILDPFMGSGTTAIACMQTNRKYIGFELDKDYYNSSLERIDKERQDITTKIGKNKECVGLAA